MAIEGQTMGRSTWAIRRPIIKEITPNINCGGRQPYQTRMPRAIVKFLIPLIAEGSIRQRSALSWCQDCHTCVAPEPHLAILCRYLYSGKGAAIDRKNGPC